MPFRVLCGATFFERLWPVWELYSLFVLAPDPQDMAVRVVSLPSGGPIRASLESFDVSSPDLACYNPNEKQQLLSAVSTEEVITITFSHGDAAYY